MPCESISWMSATADEQADERADLVRVVVGRIGRPHGLRGEVRVGVRTDEVQRRFEVGQSLLVGGGEYLTVTSARWQGSSLLVGFEGIDDRDTALALGGSWVEADVLVSELPSGPDEYFDRSLLGLVVVPVSGGEPVGRVEEVLHFPGHDVFVVKDESGGEVLVPFVSAIVTSVDLAAGIVEVDLPPGLKESLE